MASNFAPQPFGKSGITSPITLPNGAVPNAKWLEYIPQLDGITQEGLRIENGMARVSHDPGLGINWDWARLDRMAQPKTIKEGT